jgi:hypothetical protein
LVAPGDPHEPGDARAVRDRRVKKAMKSQPIGYQMSPAGRKSMTPRKRTNRTRERTARESMARVTLHFRHADRAGRY